MMPVREAWSPGETAWFEYHCYEGHDSTDAEAWYHSHQQATILFEDEADAIPDSTFEERAEACQPKVYRVRFADGLEWCVFEDELFTSPEDYERDDPPQHTQHKESK